MSKRHDRSQWMNMDKALALVAGTDGCWNWPGHLDAKGYGRVYGRGPGRSRQLKAYRVAYERFVGPIPRGREPDHTCRNPACFNPAHLELVTHKVNCLRGEGVPAQNARKTCCVHGHAFDEQNTHYYQRKNGTVMRVCRQCKLEETWRRRGKIA